MPFIDPSLLLEENNPIQRLLITCADDSNVIDISFELAKIFRDQNQSVLWIDGNLGESTPDFFQTSSDLKRVLSGELPLTQALQTQDKISILAGKSDVFLAELPKHQQYQFLNDLQKLYLNFDKVIFSVNGKNSSLQKKWMKEAQEIYLVFNAKNLFLNRTLTWLKENRTKVKGLIGLGKNDQAVLLAYMRLKEILDEIPELILDIKKIAP